MSKLSSPRTATAFTTFAAALLSVAVLSTPARAEEMTYFRMDNDEFHESVKFGHQMFTAFQCAKCHAMREGQPLNEDIIAPNLIHAKERLRPDWILAWLIDPQKLQAGTKMPNYFTFNEDDDYLPIYGDPDAHNHYKIITALRDYVMVIGTELDPDYDPDYDPTAVPVSAPAEAVPAGEEGEAPADEAAPDGSGDDDYEQDYYGY